MRLLWIFPYYLGWHYGRGTAETFVVFKNFLLFVPKFFSIGILLKTLFSPFQRLKENYSGGLNPGKFMEVITINILMRIVGFVVRSIVILFGVVAFVLTLVLLIFLFIIWILLPFLIAFAFVSSLISLF